MKSRRFELEDVSRGDPMTLARAISSLERAGAESDRLLEWLRSRTGRAFRVVFTGPGGVGKSSLIREVARRLLDAGGRVGVVAVDPASRHTRGALLGDRYRFGELQEKLFVRSIAHRGPEGTMPTAARAAADVLDAGGYDWVLLESVGSGQMDRSASGVAHVHVLVVSPHCGDELQMLKAGVLEDADLIAVTRSDEPGGAAWARRLEEALGLVSGSEPVPGNRDRAIIAVSGSSGAGVGDLVKRLQYLAAEHRDDRSGTVEPA